MLDTIALTLTKDNFMVTDCNKFSPSAQGLLYPPYYRLGAHANFRCVQNPSKEELRQGIYKPRLTLTKRMARGGFSLDLRIEFSAPKLLFGNNFDELCDEDFSRVIGILTDLLPKMGIEIKPRILEKAPVSAIHYSKNIAMTDHTTSSMIIAELGKLNLNRRLDLSHTDYRNEGHAIRYHANSYEITFYDKVKDLEQAQYSEKRAIESDNMIQLDLFQTGLFPKNLEVLRMEIRLGQRTKIKNLLQKLGITAEMNFGNLFNKSIAQNVLLSFWQQIEKDFDLLKMSAHRPEDTFSSIRKSNKLKPTKALQYLGALTLINSVGIRGLQTLVGKARNRSWQRLKKELVSLPAPKGARFNAMNHVHNSLVAFCPLKLQSYRQID